MRFSATPVTVLTGFLGAGKTTFLNRLLKDPGDRRFAIIENEFGEVGVDSELIERTRNETVVELDNGCVCCTVRGDLANALDRLQRDRADGTISFDHVVIETTGLADPGPIARTFLAETSLLEHYYLDGIVTLVDAVSGEANVARRREARAQIAYADRVVITKCDMACEREVAHLLDVVGSMNRTAQVILGRALEASSQPVEELLNLKGYQWDNASLKSLGDVPACEQGHADCNGHHDHLDNVTTLLWESDMPVDGVKFDQVMAALGDMYPETLWRVKGMLNVVGARQRIIVQGVSGLLQLNPTTYWRPFEPKNSRLVFIGEMLDLVAIRSMLDGTVVRN